MDCGRAQRWLSRELDDELSPVQVAALRPHVAQCLACQEFANSLPRVGGALATLSAPEPGLDFAARTLARLADVPQRSGRRRAPWLLRVAAAAAFIGGVWAATELASSPASQGARGTRVPEGDAELLADWFAVAPGDSVAGRYLGSLAGEEG